LVSNKNPYLSPRRNVGHSGAGVLTYPLRRNYSGAAMPDFHRLAFQLGPHSRSGAPVCLLNFYQVQMTIIKYTIVFTAAQYLVERIYFFRRNKVAWILVEEGFTQITIIRISPAFPVAFIIGLV
jgi:hypothetical protein